MRRSFTKYQCAIMAAVILAIVVVVVAAILVLPHGKGQDAYSMGSTREESLVGAGIGSDAGLNPGGQLLINGATASKSLNDYNEEDITNEVMLGDKAQDGLYHRVYLTYLFKNGYLGEDFWALPSVNYILAKHGEPLDIVNETHDNYTTSWPTIHVDSVEEDMDLRVRYYNTGCYRKDYIEHLATHRKIVLDCEYLGNGFVPAPPSVIDEYKVKEKYCYMLPKYQGYDAGADEISGEVGTDVAPEDYIHLKATYEWNGDSIGRPFPNALMVFYRFGGTGYECATRQPEIYWLDEGEQYDLRPQLTAGYRLKQGQFSGKMGSKTTILIVEYELDLKQTDGIMLLTTSIPEIAEKIRLQKAATT